MTKTIFSCFIEVSKLKLISVQLIQMPDASAALFTPE